MKRIYFIALCIFFTFTGCKEKTQTEVKPVEEKSTTTQQTTTPTQAHLIHTMSGAGCEANSWSPEIYTLYGDAATINKKLENAEMDLQKRRLYMVAIESSDGATVKLFERSKEGNVEVKEWKGKDASDFISQASRNIMANKGVACVGEQTEGLFDKMQPKSLGDIPAPISAQAAFSHDIKNMVDKYLRVSVILLC
jgi:hypothetical protein